MMNCSKTDRPPIISIITVTLNSEKFLAETIDSVRRQGYPHKEHIIIDGGSTDKTLDIIKEYEDIVKYISEPDNGISDAMNKGIIMAKGGIVSHLHSDDVYLSGTLENVANAFSMYPEKKWLIGNGEYADETGKRMWTTRLNGYSYRRLKKHNYLFHPSVFVKREVFDDVGYFDKGLKFAMDYDMWIRAGRCYEPIFMKEILSSFRVHTESLSSAEGIKALDEEYQIRMKNFADESLLVRLFYYLRYRAACMAKLCGLI